MINYNNPITINSLKDFERSILKNEKPILFWVGAGASSWTGYKRWDELAKLVHTEFSQTEQTYDKKAAGKLLSNRLYPELFEMQFKTNAQRYRSCILENLAPLPASPVYSRFIESLSLINPLYIVTTNVDNQLEKNLQNLQVIQKSDIEVAAKQLFSKKPFLLKIHGSADSIESLVFTKSEYEKLIADSNFIKFLENIFNLCHVVFIGYGLADKYLIDLFRKTQAERPLFGDGPHFAVMSSEIENLPSSFKQILYLPLPNKDHRSAIQLIEEISLIRDPKVKRNSIQPQSSEFKSAYLLSEIIPPGTWNSSETITFSSKPDLSPEGLAITGHGVTQEELATSISTSYHDLIVGLLCYDSVYVPLHLIDKLMVLVGPQVFEDILKNDVFRFIYEPDMNAVVFKDNDSLLGDLCSIRISSNKEKLENARSAIERRLKSTPGKEEAAKLIFDFIETKTSKVETATSEFTVPDITRGLLARLSIRKLLGVSGAQPIRVVPKWAVYPILRLANLVQYGIISQNLGISSVKLEFGSSELAGPAFSAITSGDFWADQIASYTIAGDFYADIGAYAQQSPSLIYAVLKFRDTQEGINLRKEIHEQLKVAAGSEISSSINGGLKKFIPIEVFQNAKNKLATLITPNNSKIIPSVWNLTSNQQSSVSLWRNRTRSEFKKIILARGLSKKDLCPCGSGEAIEDCCITI